MEGLKHNIKQSLSQVLWAFGDESVELLRELHIRAGQKATGSTLEQFETKQTENGNKLSQDIFGADHIYFLQYGRGASSEGNGSLRSIIYRWCEVKGLFAGLQKQYEKDGLAYIITRKIHQQGTFLKRFGRTFNGFSNPVSGAFTEARLKQLNEKLGQNFMGEFYSEVLKTFKYGGALISEQLKM